MIIDLGGGEDYIVKFTCGKDCKNFALCQMVPEKCSPINFVKTELYKGLNFQNQGKTITSNYNLVDRSVQNPNADVFVVFDPKLKLIKMTVNSKLNIQNKLKSEIISNIKNKFHQGSPENMTDAIQALAASGKRFKNLKKTEKEKIRGGGSSN